MTAAGGSGARAAQRLATGTRIENAALELFAAHGFASVTVEQIADAAGVARRTFFRHFPGGKQEILLLDHRRAMAEARDELWARPPQEEPLRALRTSFLRAAERFDDPAVVHRAMLRKQILAAEPSLRVRVLDEIIDVEASMIHHVALRMAVDPTEDMRPALAVATMLSATQVALATWNPARDRASELCAEALDLVESGLTGLTRVSGRAAG